jgi:hypothetical protein
LLDARFVVQTQVYIRKKSHSPVGAKNMADLKGCPFGQDIKDDCKTCDYGDTNHFDVATGKCVKR